jgi:hypothetical protein
MMVRGTVLGREAPPHPGWSRPGKPGEIVGRVKGRLAVPAGELVRLLPHRSNLPEFVGRSLKVMMWMTYLKLA